ncbi:MAG: winged helix-turn-helix domain-containing protein [Alphaproteobacteria bacterium]|nr:winged helix-turn-helix domain-containing protein [Alphaproteobacteria bacterium]MCB9793702.1 winged helix-turn-helix domain-containing protein [Alphaproteobacteria bacterium]
MGEVLIDVERGLVQRPTETVRLSEMEGRVLRFLLRHADEAVSREQLLVEVWGYSPLARTRTVDATVSRLRAKIELQPTAPEHLRTVYGVGYTLALGGPEAPPPSAHSPLIGREALLERARGLLSPHGLLTLSGPPGVGKSAALRALAEPSLQPFVHLDLQDLRDPWPALRRALSSAAATPRALTLALRQRPSLLLLLDTSAEAAEALRPHLLAWAALCRGLVLAARSPLELPGERVLVVEPLDEADGAQLIEAHLWRTSRRRLPDPQRAQLPALSARLDGLPAPLEVAAHALRTLPPSSVFELLDQGGLRILDARTPRLREAFRQLPGSLSEAERLQLCSIAAFPAGVRCSAIAEVLEGEDRAQVLATLERLTQRGLVQIRGERAFALRSVREVLLERAEGEAERAQVLALRWMAKLARGLADPPHLEARLQRLHEERANLDALWGVAVQRGDPRAGVLAEALLVGHVEEGSLSAGERVYAITCALPSLSDPRRAALRFYRGLLLQRAGDQELAYLALREALDTPGCPPEHGTLAAATLAAVCSSGLHQEETSGWLERPPHPGASAWVRAVAARAHALAYVRLGRFEDARAALSPARRVFRRAGDLRNELRCLLRLSWVAAEQGRLSDARRALERAAELAGQDLAQLESSELSLGVVLHDAGDIEGAVKLLRRGVARVRGAQREHPEFASNLGWVLVEAGAHPEAAELLLRSIDTYERLAHWANFAIATLNLAALRHLQGQRAPALELVTELGRRAEGELPKVLRAFAEGQRAALLADLGRAEDARAALHEARALGEDGDRVLQRVLAYRAAHVALCEAPPERREGLLAELLTELSRLEDEAPVQCSDVRIARSTLLRAAEA